ncbi:hypothetical protein A3H86_00880 [Candidatus Roizmanbacteria bacterium RIFCSPLOWO2_02_FULL_41_9]|uniref:Uncharacterized protein n=2 Tax=Candidatus Roizmaniibacteriota TaxID=1752723 RepID=A0A1F7JR25_9BACT|nr:MAG: hypothetical protein A3H86_00880 [Candidatus Roizmanbacteria bacterium RIFCSPLOWO2_02_FULL_41_9]
MVRLESLNMKELFRRNLMPGAFVEPQFSNIPGREGDIRGALMKLGCDYARWLGEDSRLGKPYLDQLRKDLLHGAYLGEVPIPESLYDSQKNALTQIIGHTLPNGLGHARVEAAIAFAAKILGFQTDVNRVGELDYQEAPTPKTSEFEKALFDKYANESLKEAEAKGMVTDLEKFKEGRYAYTPLIETLRRIFPRQYHDLLHGRQSNSKEEINRLRRLAKILFGKEYRQYLRSLASNPSINKVTHIIPHPFFIPLIPEEFNAVVVTTDAIVASDWYTDAHPLFIESKTGKRKLIEFWGDGAADNVTVLEGFPALTGVYRVEELTKRRQNALENSQGLKPMLVLTASGIAPVQLSAFKKTVKSSLELIRAEDMSIVIQAGYGKLGKIAFDQLKKYIDELEVNDSSLIGKILVHWAPESAGAVDFFEVMSHSLAPLVLNVKGSEMARMAASINIPFIPTGVVGVQEIYNLYTSLLPESAAPVFLIPEVYDQLERELRKLLTQAEFTEIESALKEAKCDDFETAFNRSLEYIKSGEITPRDRSAVLQILSAAVSKN